MFPRCHDTVPVLYLLLNRVLIRVEVRVLRDQRLLKRNAQ